jgi:ATP-dependent helicase/nuclease subunit A
MSARIIPDSVRALQIKACTPTASAFVSANAGAGKTHVLAQRVIRLLLAGVPPEKILCITFTKAAAANMAKRVFETLSGWIAVDDAALDQKLLDVGVLEVSPAQRALARRLFAAALETPGGLKMQTIHAFCTQLLHQFPFEANVAAAFTVLDEHAEQELLGRAGLATLLDAAAVPESPLGRALSTAITAAADSTLREVIAETIGDRDAITDWIKRAGSVEGAVIEIAQTLGIAADDTMAQVEADIVDGPFLPSASWPTAKSLFEAGSPNDGKQAERLDTAIKTSGSSRIESYLKIFFGTEGQPRDKLITNPLADEHPDFARRLGAEQARLTGLRERRRAIMTRDRTAALIAITDQVLKRYRMEKDQRGLLDYDDLIDKTLAMLVTVNPTWIHYKLDLGIDHVLIDEAQDTSPKQWQIIQQLVAEFTAGAGARGNQRTLFAVGDEKQSIFSFQGAQPRQFDEMRRKFTGRFTAAELGWHFVRLQHSFRSGANVLAAVDRVFARKEIFLSVTADAGGIPPHAALPETAPGMVEVWPLVSAEDRREIQGWDAPFDQLAETSPPVRLAQRIARNVSSWITRGTRPGDVLILVRQRGPLFEAIIRALKEKNVAVAGADRLLLTEHIAIVDLIALADALLLPDDDLALAVALKCPLFGLDDDMLFKLAWNRAGTLRSALRARAGDDPAFAAAASLLVHCDRAARQQTPFAFYAWLLGPQGGRARILARLGPEATDALDEFLELALEYEQRHIPSLQGFVAWLRTAGVEIKRDAEMTRDEVRVMTVHGAKGLEAQIVILADTTTRPNGPRPPRLLKISTSGTPDRIVWAAAVVTDVPIVAAARRRALNAAEDEYRRLLYVAMTRAANRLVVCGFEGRTKRPERCWYDLVFDALHGDPDFVAGPAEDGDGTVWRYQPVSPSAPPNAGPTAAPAEPLIIVPDWLRCAAPQSPPPSPVILPSSAFDDGPQALNTSYRSGPRDGRKRGILIHRLMQSLPDIAPERRARAGRQYLAHAGKDLSESERESLLSEVLAIFRDQRFAPLFAPGSRAEIPIIGRIPFRDGAKRISGQVDRMAVTADLVLVVDYKTNHPAPRCFGDVPHQYLAQLALYRAVLASVYPGRTIRTAIVWTDVPDLMEFSMSALEDALAAQ